MHETTDELIHFRAIKKHTGLYPGSETAAKESKCPKT